MRRLFDGTNPASPASAPAPRGAHSRRSFLHTAAVAGGGLVIGFYAQAGMRRLAAQPGPKKGLPRANAFVRIGADDTVTVSLSHSEMGQGIWTTLPMLLNEELGADWAKVRDDHLPSSSDGEYLNSLMTGHFGVGEYAGWIAAPKVGIDNKPGDFEYVKIENC